MPFVIRKKKIDIVIVDNSSLMSPFFLSWKLFNIPLLWDMRTITNNNKRSILKDISLYISKYVAVGYTTITQEAKDIIIKEYKLQDKKIGVWPSGIPKEFLLKKNNYKNDKLKEESDLFILIYHGSYNPLRGIENLIRSLPEIPSTIREKIKLLLVGITGKKQEELIQLCEELKIRKNVEIISNVEFEKIPSYIQSADVGVIPLPPDIEWWRISVPLKTLEYLALEKPIIATNIPFHQKIFNIAEVGILLDTNSPIAIANAVTNLYKNREKLKEMGKRGKEIVEKYYTWDNIAIEFEDFIKTLVTK